MATLTGYKGLLVVEGAAGEGGTALTNDLKLLADRIESSTADLATHIADIGNPHTVTVSQDATPQLAGDLDVVANKIYSSTADQDMVVEPNGTGAFQLSSTGNSRGTNAVDLQVNRAADTGVASGNYSGIGGGSDNLVSGGYSTISGGQRNAIPTIGYGVISGGYGNTVSAQYGAIGGGNTNTVTSSYGIIGGGRLNEIAASCSYSTISGGWNNLVTGSYSANYATIAGGVENKIDASSSNVLYCFVGGGHGNKIQNTLHATGPHYSGIMSGLTNTIDGYCRASVIASGETNTIQHLTTASYNFIGSGKNNRIGSDIVGSIVAASNFIGSGADNVIELGTACSIFGGNNSIGTNGSYGVNNCTIAGGTGNKIADTATAGISYSMIGSGQANRMRASHGFIGAGVSNVVEAQYSSVVGGAENVVESTYSFIGGGYQNTIEYASEAYSCRTIGGGKGNIITTPSAIDANMATIAGGLNNRIGSTISLGSFNFCSISGGYGNKILNEDAAFAINAAVISGGYTNFVKGRGAYSSIGGGQNNVVYNNDQSVNFSTIGGGSANRIGLDAATAAADYNTIAGGDASLIEAGNYNSIGGGDNCVITTDGWNVISGGRLNNIDDQDGAQSCVVAGGQSNRIGGDSVYSTSNLCTISGGQSNLIQNSVSAVGSPVWATIGGGFDNTIDGYCESCVIAGGYTNMIRHLFYNYSNVISGGKINRIGSDNIGAAVVCKDNVIAGGYNNRIGRSYGSVICGGGSNTIADSADVNGMNCSIVGGHDNEINMFTHGSECIIAGGSDNRIEGYRCSILGGQDNYCSAITSEGGHSQYSAIISSKQGKTTMYGQHAHAAGMFANQGDAQTSVLVMRRQTTTVTETELFLDGEDAFGLQGRMELFDQDAWVFSILVVGRRVDADNEGAAYKFEGAIDRNGATVALIGSVTKTELAEDTGAWDANVVADNTNNSLRINVTGENSKTINWVARVELVQVNG